MRSKFQKAMLQIDPLIQTQLSSRPRRFIHQAFDIEGATLTKKLVPQTHRQVGRREGVNRWTGRRTVSYTHLTLPTNREV